jgi:hypothetical protein
MNTIRLIKTAVKRMGFGNVKYHSFIGRSYETLKFYTCSPNDHQLSDLNWYLYDNNIEGSAKLVKTIKHPYGFLEITIRK